MHNEKIKTLMKIGHINEKDMKDLIVQSQNVLKDVDDDQADGKEENEETRDRRFTFIESNKGEFNDSILAVNFLSFKQVRNML